MIDNRIELFGGVLFNVLCKEDMYERMMRPIRDENAAEAVDVYHMLSDACEMTENEYDTYLSDAGKWWEQKKRKWLE